MHINPERLRKLRTTQNLSRQRLSIQSGVSPRQLLRLEDDSAASQLRVRQKTIADLATALGIEPGVLTDELPMPEDLSAETSAEAGSVKVSVTLEPEVQLACDLIERRYRVPRKTIFNLAPLLFALIAEGSMAWRRKKLADAENAAERLSIMLPLVAEYARHGASLERGSIENTDLFRKEVGREASHFGYNPLTMYLHELATQIDSPGAIQVHSKPLNVTNAALANIPSYLVCKDELRQIVGRSEKAALALIYGHARLRDIPDELQGEDATEQRVRWLEEKFPSFKLSADESAAFCDWLSDPDAVEEAVQKIQQAPDHGGTGDDA